MIIAKESPEIHKEKLQTVLKNLDEKNLAISIDKCKFSCKQVEWLGYNIQSERTKPLIKKTEAIEKLNTPKNFLTFENLYGLYTSPHTITPLT